MSFVLFLLLLHVAGAIIGFGPTFGFAVLGPLASKTGGPQAVGIMEGMVAIERKLVIPVAAVIQPVTGVLLIFQTNRDEDFFAYEWLWISILLYIAAFYVAVFVQTPTLDRMISMARSGQADSPAFAALGKRASTTGPALTLALVVIIFLMIVKPG